jgi:acetolactate synthase I/II/III large subunit
MKLSDFVIRYLVSAKVTHIFEVCGGAVMHMLDSAYGRKDISIVSMHHEQAASFAAEGYARAEGRIGVAMATSGPGATNFITGIGSCFFDSVPSIFITGQVNTYEFKFNKPVRQVGFQETDIVSIVKPVVKGAFLVKDAGKIKHYLDKCVKLALSGRPGPVLLDIPMNIQRAEISPSLLKGLSAEKNPQPGLKRNQLRSIIKLLKSSSRPVILAGGGVRIAKADKGLAKLVKLTGIPVVSTLMGLDAFSHDSASYAGMIGTYGNRYANLTVANSDLVLALGTRFDTRQTGTKPETFARKAKIIHVDIDRNELKHKFKHEVSVHSDIKTFLDGLLGSMDTYNKQDIAGWLRKISSYKKRYPSYTAAVKGPVEPNHFMHILSNYLPKDALISVDIGQNQIWAAQSIDIRGSQRLITQGGMGAMGSALSMGIGASFARPGKTVVIITGDGGFQLNIQELETLRHHGLPVKIILLNNHCYGMVRQFQEQYFNSRFQSTVVGYSCPDYQDVVSAYKIPSKSIKDTREISGALKKLFSRKGPGFLEVMIDPGAQITPKLSVDKPVEDQDPPLSRNELASNMLIAMIPEGKDAD